MNTNNKYFVSIIALVMLTSLMTSVSAATKVYFFQVKTTGTYTLAGEYKVFGDRLSKDMGYTVAVLGTGLSMDSLKTLDVDILLIPNLATDLTPDEMVALYQFAMEGKGVFILGGTPSANKITTPMGMAVVEDRLEDGANQVIDKSTGLRIAEKTTFLIDLPVTRTDFVVSNLTKGVKTVNVFGANGLYLFGNAKGVVFAGDSANSPKSLNFPPGSNPPVAAYVKLGKGMVFLLSDEDMLTNTNLDSAKFSGENLKLATNAIDWLSTPSTDGLTTDQLEDIIKALQVEKISMNRTITSCSASEENLKTEAAALKASNSQAQMQLSGCQNTKFMGIEYIVWAIIGAGLLVAVSLFFAMSKKKGGKKSKKGSGELGYEFDNKSSAGGEFSEGDANLGGEVKEEDIAERLKELEKKGSDQQA